MDTGFFDMLQDSGHYDVITISHTIDIHLDRIAQIAVDQHRAVARNAHSGFDIVFELRLRVDNLHRPTTEDIARPHQHRITDGFGNLDCFFATACNAVFGLFQLQLVDQRSEALAILS